MLLALRIENFALVDHLELDLSAGLTVLTGETGAGKSIVLDALDAVLGGKVTSRSVRAGAERATIAATFQANAALQTWLTHHQLGDGETGTLTCSREITATGGSQRSRSRINGNLVNKQQMEQLRDRLVEITAQGQTMQIGQAALQRDWLDNYGGALLLQQRDKVGHAYQAVVQANQALEKRRQAEAARLQQLDLFEYQLRELNEAHLQEPDELEQLQQEAKRLAHSVELQHQSYQIYQILYQNDHGTDACADMLGRAEHTLQDMVEYDTELQPMLELVTNALAQVQEASREINAYGAGIEADPQRLQDVQDRIGELKQICRKYGPDLADAIALRDRLQAELHELTGGGQSLEDLETACKACAAVLTQECQTLSQLRQNAAQDLQARLVAELKPLAMDKVQFCVQITPCSPNAMGADQVTFLFSPNPGEPLQPLGDIASGGEMSRFLLALKASFSQIDPVGTMVFDEIDVGVSGRVSQAIAEKLYQLSQHHQVLCVTHQPIVAAMADQHFRVSKHLINQDGQPSSGQSGQRRNVKSADRVTEAGAIAAVRTVVRLTSLAPEQRRDELAQLAGGQLPNEVTGEGAAYAFAESLLVQANSLRQTQSNVIDADQEFRARRRGKSNRVKTAKNA